MNLFKALLLKDSDRSNILRAMTFKDLITSLEVSQIVFYIFPIPFLSKREIIKLPILYFQIIIPHTSPKLSEIQILLLLNPMSHMQIVKGW